MPCLLQSSCLAGVAHGRSRAGLHRAVQMVEAQDTQAAPLQQESWHPLRHRTAGPIQFPFRAYAARRGVQRRGTSLLSRSFLAAAAVHRAGGNFPAGAGAALSQRCVGWNSDRGDNFRLVAQFLNDY